MSAAECYLRLSDLHAGECFLRRSDLRGECFELRVIPPDEASRDFVEIEIILQLLDPVVKRLQGVRPVEIAIVIDERENSIANDVIRLGHPPNDDIASKLSKCPLSLAG